MLRTSNIVEIDREVDKKTLEENVIAINAISDILCTSLGPNARSKLIIDPKGKYVAIINDF